MTTMLDSQNQLATLRSLRKLRPINAVAVVGAMAPDLVKIFEKLDISNPSIFAILDPEMEDEFRKRGANIESVLISSTSETRQFHKYNLHYESGLLDRSDLASLWRNIELIESEDVSTRTLDQVLLDRTPRANWFFVESLSTLEAMEGAQQCLQDADIVMLRAAGQTDAQSSIGPSTVDQVKDYMRERGFVVFAHCGTRHAQISRLLFVKDLKRVLKNQDVQIIETREKLEKQASKIAELQRFADHRLAKIETLSRTLSFVAAAFSDIDLDDLETLPLTLRQISENAAAYATDRPDVETATGRQVMAENNLKDLQSRFQVLTEENADLVQRLDTVRAELEDALNGSS